MYPLNPAKADYSVNKVYRIHFLIVRRATGTGQSALWSQVAGRKRDGWVPPRKGNRAGMSFVIPGYPIVIVENKDPGDSHALEHHAPPCSYAGTGKSWIWSVSRPTALAGAGFEESLDGPPGGFVGDCEAGEPLQCRLAVLNRFVRGFEGGHFDWVPTKCDRVDLATLQYSLAYRRCLGLVGGRGSRRFIAIDLSLPVGHIHVVLTVQERNDE